ncbi:hypothetical protein D3C76_902990 [compost metagenome]
MGKHFVRNALAGDPVEAVAPGDVIAVDSVGLAIFLVGDVGAVALHVVGLHVFDRIDDRGTQGAAGLHQIARDFGLPIDHDSLATGQCLEIDMNTLAGHQQLDALVDQAFGIHAFGYTCFAQQVDGALLQHPGTNSAEDVVRCLAFDDDVVDAGVMQ